MLNGQVAIVTGASRGIGEGILRVLAGAHATVVGTSTTEKGAERQRVAPIGNSAGQGDEILNLLAPEEAFAGL